MGKTIEASVKVVKHNPNWANVFGDAAQSFNAKAPRNGERRDHGRPYGATGSAWDAFAGSADMEENLP
jgi:hypothetical protein